MDLRTQFARNCQQNYSWHPNSSVLLAISGGVDSMVLLDLMEHLPTGMKPRYHVAHINHQLRSVSDTEERFLAEYCRERHIPFYCKKWEADQHPITGIEAAARKVRYAFFQEVMEKEGINQLLTAHHGDDQMETIFMRLVRGSHLSGLTGIKSRRQIKGTSNEILRPLLTFSKADLLEYSQVYDVPYCEDETNQSLVYTRNRYRNQVIPLLKKENSHALNHILDFSEDLEDLLTLVEPILQEAVEKVVLKKSQTEVQLDNQRLLQYEPALRSQVMNHLFNQMQEEQGLHFQRSHIKKVLELVTSTKGNGRIHLSKEWEAVKSYQILTIALKRASIQPEPQWFSQQLSLNTMQKLPNGDQIGFFTTDSIDETVVNAADFKIWLALESVQLPLTVRQRKNGDRMTLKGKITATRKIKNILIDQKIPLEDRSQAYLVEDFAGKILWLIKYKESQLSIDQETDKIQYILVYQKNELY